MGVRSYKEAGVDIQKGEDFASFIRAIDSPAISHTIGGFSGGTEIDTAGYSRPVLMSTTDGVGTKIMVAKSLNTYSTIGIDLVAMCVNDLIVCGARPVQFLDYIACGAVDEQRLSQIIQGIVKGCEEGKCVLSGGETAEMPDMYGKDEIDLAGFCTGIAEKEEILPKTELMVKGDIILGLPSGGIHSNGLSLARKILSPSSLMYEELLAPTIVYVSTMSVLLSSKCILGAAHITGGGLHGNIKRIIPSHLKADLNWDWDIPEIFTTIQETGNIETSEMRKVFNMGIGIAVIVHPADEKKIRVTAKNIEMPLLAIGRLI